MHKYVHLLFRTMHNYIELDICKYYIILEYIIKLDKAMQAFVNSSESMVNSVMFDSMTP